MTTRVKLVAIAKDEAAYLPDWIHHHLYFGFDSIDVYINNTNDNSGELTQLVQDDRVTFLDGDIFFSEEIAYPQEELYRHAYKLYSNSAFTHLMFLDVDEFWTPLNFTDSIHDCLAKIDADVISFEWLNRQSEKEPFSEPFPEKITGARSRFVKSVFSLQLKLDTIYVHNVYSENLNYCLADGSLFLVKSRDNAEVPNTELEKPLKPYFVVHRMFRSEMEYISLLGRGRPKNINRHTSIFKNNRPGYCNLPNNGEFIPPVQARFSYQESRQHFLNQYANAAYMAKARAYIKQRFDSVNEMIKNAPSHENETLKIILRNISIEPTSTIYNTWKNNHLTASEIDQLRDTALLCERIDLELAYRIMVIAQAARPNGVVINKKIEEYRRQLKL